MDDLQRLEEQLRLLRGLQEQQAAVASQPSIVPNTGILNEGQTLGGLWKDPTENQRQGLLMAGLSLLSSSDNNNLSQRIGQAIGQGATTINEGRAMEAARAEAARKREMEQLGLRTDSAQQNFTNLLDLAKLQKDSGTDIDINLPGEAKSTFIDELSKSQAKAFSERRVKAIELTENLPNVFRAQEILEQGIITGTAADFRKEFGKALNTIGINFNEDEVANTEAFVARQAEQVAEIIKAFGAGTGLSDADREFATKAAGGDIAMSETAIKKILNDYTTAVTNVATNFNLEAEQIQSMKNEQGVPLFPLPLSVTIPTKSAVKFKGFINGN